MLLVDQVDLLRQHILQLRNQRLVLPLMGGLSATHQTYRFKSLVHPARDIAATISEADPGGNKLPEHLRGWNLDVRDGGNQAKTIHVKKLLGMIIHVYYLHIVDNQLDIANDFGERVIVPYDIFVSSVERLILTSEDICLVVCSLAEERFKSETGIQALLTNVPGSGDLMHCLATISRWPELEETIWKTFFVDESAIVESNCQTVSDVPFIMGGHQTETRITWNVGWRRDGKYASVWINVFDLICQIRSHFYEQHATQ